MGRDRAQGGKGEESEEALGSEDCEGHWNMKMASRQEVEMVRTTKIVRTRWNSQQVKMTKVKMLWRKKRESRCEGNQQCEESREDMVGSQTTLSLSGSGNT